MSFFLPRIGGGGFFTFVFFFKKKIGQDTFKIENPDRRGGEVATDSDSDVDGDADSDSDESYTSGDSADSDEVGGRSGKKSRGETHTAERYNVSDPTVLETLSDVSYIPTHGTVELFENILKNRFPHSNIRVRGILNLVFIFQSVLKKKHARGRLNRLVRTDLFH